jgi:hypothetical protein
MSFQAHKLHSIPNFICRYLKENNYGTTIAHGPAFATTMLVFATKTKDLKRQGKGQKPKTAAPVSDAEIEKLHNIQLLGTSTPESLINTLWLNNTIHFGMRGGTEHRQV